jgi:hypothetical protein
MPGLNQRHRSQPRQNCSSLQHGRARVNKGHANAHGQNLCPEQIYPSLGRPKLTILSPDTKETLLLYTFASQKAVSAALVVERDTDGNRRQYPVYFASEALAGSKLHYSKLEKIAYAIIKASPKLHHYFEAHRIVAISDQPLHDLLHNREASPRIAKWDSEL